MKTGNNKNYPILRVGIWSKYDDLSRSSLICCHNTQCIKYFTISCNSSSSNSSVQSVIVSATWNMVLLSAQLFLISLLNFFSENFFFHTRMLLLVRLLILVLSIISVVHSFIINSREWNSGVMARLIDTWSNLDIISDEDILETEDVEMIWNLELWTMRSYRTVEKSSLSNWKMWQV